MQLQGNLLLPLKVRIQYNVCMYEELFIGNKFPKHIALYLFLVTIDLFSLVEHTHETVTKLIFKPCSTQPSQMSRALF